MSEADKNEIKRLKGKIVVLENKLKVPIEDTEPVKKKSKKKK